MQIDIFATKNFDPLRALKGLFDDGFNLGTASTHLQTMLRETKLELHEHLYAKISDIMVAGQELSRIFDSVNGLQETFEICHTKLAALDKSSSSVSTLLPSLDRLDMYIQEDHDSHLVLIDMLHDLDTFINKHLFSQAVDVINEILGHLAQFEISFSSDLIAHLQARLLSRKQRIRDIVLLLFPAFPTEKFLEAAHTLDTLKYKDLFIQAFLKSRSELLSDLMLYVCMVCIFLANTKLSFPF